jgi:hypothetical protein
MPTITTAAAAVAAAACLVMAGGDATDPRAPLQMAGTNGTGWLQVVAEHASAAYCGEGEGHQPIPSSHAPGEPAEPPPNRGQAAESVESESSRAIVSTDPFLQGAVVSFRGSVTDVNWIRNFDFTPVYPWPSSPDVGIHAGFWATYAELRAGIRGATATALDRSRDCRIWLTGHSLGGALAAIMAVDVHLHPLRSRHCSKPSISLVSFGSPRPAGLRFAELYSTLPIPTWRIARADDAVPLIATGRDARHVGHLHMFAANFTHCVGMCRPLDATCESALSPHPLSAAAATLAAHRMYVGVAMGRRACVSSQHQVDKWASAVHSVLVIARALMLFLVVLIRVFVHLLLSSPSPEGGCRKEI